MNTRRLAALAVLVASTPAALSWARCGGDPECYERIREMAIQRQYEEAQVQRLKLSITPLIPAADARRIQSALEAERGNTSWIQFEAEFKADAVTLAPYFTKHLTGGGRATFPAYALTNGAIASEGFVLRPVDGVLRVAEARYRDVLRKDQVEQAASRALVSLLGSLNRQDAGEKVSRLQQLAGNGW